MLNNANKFGHMRRNKKKNSNANNNRDSGASIVFRVKIPKICDEITSKKMLCQMQIAFDELSSDARNMFRIYLTFVHVSVVWAIYTVLCRLLLLLQHMCLSSFSSRHHPAGVCVFVPLLSITESVFCF